MIEGWLTASIDSVAGGANYRRRRRRPGVPFHWQATGTLSI